MHAPAQSKCDNIHGSFAHGLPSEQMAGLMVEHLHVAHCVFFSKRTYEDPSSKIFRSLLFAKNYSARSMLPNGLLSR